MSSFDSSDHHDSGHHDYDPAQHNPAENALHHFFEVQSEGVIPYWIHHFPHDSQDNAAQTGTQTTAHEGNQATSGNMPYSHFHPDTTRTEIVGNPDYALDSWHYQQRSEINAVAAQEFLLEYYGQHFSIAVLEEEALAHGWYRLHLGTPVAYTGELLAYHGLPFVCYESATSEVLWQTLKNEQPVLVALNTAQIWYNGTDYNVLSAYPGIPGQQATHVVEVIGMDSSDPHHPLVIINDPTHPDGQGLQIPLAHFEQAWAASHHLMLSVGNLPYLQEREGLADQLHYPARDVSSEQSWNNWLTEHASYKADWVAWTASMEPGGTP